MMMTIEQRKKKTEKRKRAPFAGSRQKDTPPSFFPLPPAWEEPLRRAPLTLADTDAPRLTAEALLSHMLGITRVQLLSRPKWELPAEALARFERLVARAARGGPPPPPPPPPRPPTPPAPQPPAVAFPPGAPPPPRLNVERHGVAGRITFVQS